MQISDQASSAYFQNDSPFSQKIDAQALLGRNAIRFEPPSTSPDLTGKSVMVTGAAGSLGSELCRQILENQPSRLICIDRSETDLFYLQSMFKDPRCLFGLADYGDSGSMRRILNEHLVEIVFHAAAYKHIAMLERNLRPAVQNNVFNLCSFLEVAAASGCRKFVLASSDKAVNPTSIMGASKRICELVLASRENPSMRCISVRFGNILGSHGSVLPIFRKQIVHGVPLTVTHPEVARFFLTVEEAAALVLRATSIGENRDLFVLQVGEEVRILELANRLLVLANKPDLPILVTGLRPGEKLHEEFWYADEELLPTPFPYISRTVAMPIDGASLDFKLGNLRQSMYAISDDGLRARIRELVPHYRYGYVSHGGRGGLL